MYTLLYHAWPAFYIEIYQAAFDIILKRYVILVKMIL